MAGSRGRSITNIRPGVLWAGIAIVVGAVSLWVSSELHGLYWRTTIRRVQVVDWNMLHATLPYALAHLEEHGRDDLLQGVVDSNFGLFGIVYTDASGKVRARTASASARYRWDEDKARTASFSDVARTPTLPQVRAATSRDDSIFSQRSRASPQGDLYGKVYLVNQEGPSLWNTLTTWRNWSKLFPWDPSDYFVIPLVPLVAGLVILAVCGIAWRLHRKGRLMRERLIAQLITERDRVEIECSDAQKDALAAKKLADERQADLDRQIEQNVHDKERIKALQSDRDEAKESWIVAEERVTEKDEELRQKQAEIDTLKRTATPPPASPNHTEVPDGAWPGVEWSPGARREMKEVWRGGRTDKARTEWVIRTACALSLAKGDPTSDVLHRVGELKPWHGKKGVYELKHPPSRMYVVARDVAFTVECIVLNKSTTTDKAVDRYFR